MPSRAQAITARVLPIHPRPWYALREPAVVVGLALLIAVAAQVRLYLPGNPVPVTLQTLAVVLAGLWARPASGTTAVLIYLIAGAAGLPVFADSRSGWSAVTGPTAGYLLGFLAVPFVVGAFSRDVAGRRRSWLVLALVGLIAHAVVLTPGVLWLKLVTGRDWSWVLTNGLAAFIPGSVLKSIIAAGFAGR